MATKPFKLLVVEDDQFQRLALIDILTLCDYEVNAVDCGAAAIDELNKPENEFDLVLLDLILPDIDGLEVLKTMKKEQKFQDLPVVMMSANEGTEIIASCVEFGAKDYLVKPLRINVVKGLKAKYMNKELTNGLQIKVKEQDNVSGYEKEKELGRGAAGSVWSVKRRKDGQKLAMKIIPLAFLKDQQEKKQAQNEVTLLKLLLGPTIVRYYDSFSDNENLYILMELLEGGNLSDKIKQQSNSGKPFQKEVILEWIGQITIALMLMHNKKVLHRDIKSQNMFLTKDNIIKIGDFGISKEMATFADMAKTSCGTPYFMCPEVCKGQPYDQKADIWSFGCLIYELATFKKPFDGENVQAVWDQIVNKPISPLPSNVDGNIKMIILQLLNKEPAKRPDIWEVYKIPVVKETIDRFCEKNQYTELPLQSHSVKPKKEEIKEEEETKSNENRINMEKIDEYASILKQELNPRKVSAGWFKKVDNCVSGKDIVQYFIEKMNFDEEVCMEIGQKLIEKSFIHCVKGKPQFENSNDAYYIFQADRKDVPLNMTVIYSGEPRNALIISVELATYMGEILKQYYGFSEEDNDYVLNVEETQKCDYYLKYLHTSSELENCNLHSLKKKEKVLFFLNIYQCMLCHMIISNYIKSGEKTKGLLGKLKSYMSKEKIVYCIAKMNFTLAEVKHGILRGNRKAPGSIMRTLGSSDIKLQHSNNMKYDPLILLICNDYPNIPSDIHVFNSEETFEKELADIAADILSNSVLFNDDSGELTLPTVINTYKSDFGDDDAERIKKIWKYCNSDCSIDKVLKSLKKGNLFIRYSDEAQEES